MYQSVKKNNRKKNIGIETSRMNLAYTIGIPVLLANGIILQSKEYSTELGLEF